MTVENDDTPPTHDVKTPNKSLENALKAVVAPQGRICITIPDSTRNMDRKTAIEALSTWLPTNTNAVILIGLGLHRKSSQQELSELQSISPWPVRDHDPDTCVSIGSDGDIPIDLPAEVLEADALVCAGTIELHQYAGYSGGYKAFVVGCGSRRSISALHHRDFICHKDIQVGQLHNNPFREHIDRIGQLLPPTTALQFVEEQGWYVGDPIRTIRGAANQLDSFYPVEETVEKVVLHLPESKSTNFYQASRAATYLALSPHPPLKPGAQIIIQAACPDGIGSGFGEKNCADALRSCAPPWTALLSGDFPFQGGAQRAVMLARLAQRFELVVAGCDHPEALRALGITAYSQNADEMVPNGTMTVHNPFRKLPQLASFR